MPSLLDAPLIARAPIGLAKNVLLVPVRALREVAVVAARTVRHWEVVLSVAAAPETDPVAADPADAADLDGSVDAAELEVDVRDSRDLPVDDWPQLSLADAQARSAACGPTDLATLLAYEQRHGHRAAFELMLQQRLRQAVG